MRGKVRTADTEIYDVVSLFIESIYLSQLLRKIVFSDPIKPFSELHKLFVLKSQISNPKTSLPFSPFVHSIYLYIFGKWLYILDYFFKLGNVFKFHIRMKTVFAVS